jgi:hypothetical protein
MAVAAAVSLYLQIVLKWDSDRPRDFAFLMLVTTGITTLAWLTITMLTAPEPPDQLVLFYRRVRPGGPGWKRIAAKAGEVDGIKGDPLGAQFLNWTSGCVLIYASLFGIGKLVFKEWGTGLALTAVAVAAAVLISRNLKTDAQ